MSILSTVLPFAGAIEKVIDRLFPNPEDRAKAQMAVLEMEQRGEFHKMDTLARSDAGQAAINVEDAKSDSFFQYGWRPAAGWVCVLALFAQYFGVPLLTWIATNTLEWSPPPALDLSELVVLLFGMLGLGAYRTYEKRTLTK